MKPFVEAELRSERKKTSRGRRQMLESLPPVPIVRAWAERTIAATPVGELRPGAHWNAARKASRVAFDAAAKQDWSTAYSEKLRELRNVELYRASTNAKNVVEQQTATFHDMFRADSRLVKFHDMDYVSAARAIAATILGMPQNQAEAFTYMKRVQDYDPDLYETLSDQIESVLGSQKTVEQMPFAEFQAAADVINSLWAMSSRNRMIEIEGKLMERQEAILQLTIRASRVAKPGRASQGYRSAVTRWQKAEMGLLGIKAALRRVESWVDAIDGGDPNGPFRKYVWQPISGATAKYRAAKVPVLQRYLELLRPIESTLNTGKIAAPELDYVFKNKGELLHAVLHSGNESNLQKLLRGRGWGDYDNDGKLNRSRWDGFLDRLQATGVLRKADFDFVQGVWDLFESQKPAAQKAHRALYGGYFKEITADPVETRFGVYRGGYVPAIVDPFIAPDAAARSDKAALSDSQNSWMFPSTGRGFTRSRLESYAKPLQLDLGILPAHLDRVLRFTHIQPAMKDVARILFDRDFQQTLGNVDPAVRSDMLVPWLQRAATQRVSTPSQGRAGRAADRFFTELRKRTGLQLMTANVVNTLQQFTGLSISAVKVKPRYLIPALWTYVRAPFETARRISDKSEFMKTRTTAQAFEIQQTIDDLLASSKYEKVRDFAGRHAYFLQAGTQNIVDLATWQGAYDQAVESGAGEAAAVQRADSAVRLTQGSFAPEDVAAFETKSPFARLFTQFSGYFNMQANLLGTEFTIARDLGLRAGAGRAVYVYLLGFLIPAALSEMLVRAMSAEGLDADRDESYLDDFLSVFFGGQARAAAGMIPGVGPAVLAMANAFNDKEWDDRISTSPAVSMIEASVRAPQEVYQVLTDPDRSKKRAIKDTLSLIGLLSGLPTGALGRPAGYLADVAERRVEPESTADFARGVLSGR